MPAPGLLEDVNDAATLIPYTSLDRLAEMEQSGRLRGGMRPKFAAAQAALEHGVAGVHLVSGMLPDALLIEIFTNEGSGTMIVNDLDPAAANTIL
jgi:acetylglutamate kinase